MPDFLVCVSREAIGFREFVVRSADTKKHAEDIAMAAAGNFEFGERSAEYEVSSTLPLSDVNHRQLDTIPV